jgi:DNA ligase (NAD+)
LQEKNFALFTHALEILRIQNEEENIGGALNDLTFVITGDISRFKNRRELQNFIEANGGKTTGSVTEKTNFLINNDAHSTSGKNKNAQKLGVKIITEENFFAEFFPKN